jgi:hypothetical protein
MPHICRLMVADFQRDPWVSRFDDRGAELYDDYDLGCAVCYCEDLLADGETVCPVQGWCLEGMRVWAAARLAEHKELLDAR